ncbi:hypothetical protein [Eisenbergiella porci]|uniref:hypothetical protein n=1 Tax=Eisenbergiella porci TaxID=2652274 RepID=UPI002A812A84|nr:hypothetical protein [Eisenbergiella porci]
MNGNQVMLHEILRNECCVMGKAQAMDETVARLRRCEAQGDSLGDEARRLLKTAVEELSNGENTVLYDDLGIPSVMVRIPAMRCGKLLEDCGKGGFHPAFVAGERIIREVWVSKYLNCVVDGRAASLPMCTPKRIGTFDEAVAICRAKGDNWMPMPFQLRMAIALWCRSRGFLPSGNNDHGHDFFHPGEEGVLSGANLTLTGSGPPEWSHNGRREGIWDLNGNLNEWDVGFRLMDGEIQLIGMEELLMPGGDLSSESSLWRGLGTEGKLVPAGSADALHYAVPEGGIQLSQKAGQNGIGNCAFRDIRAQRGLKIPDTARLLGLFPPDCAKAEASGWRWVNTEGEMMPLCGGAYGVLDHAGIFFAGMTKPRKEDYKFAGVRCVYVEPQAIEEG